MNPNNRPQRILALILIVSTALRFALVLRGGQAFFPDEERYLTARKVIQHQQDGLITDALAELTKEADHLGFKILGLAPAWVEAQFGPNLQIPALFFSLFSVVNIWLIYQIAKQAGADPNTGLLAAALMASSNSLQYFSAHLLPYDPALTFGLLSLLFAVSPKPGALAASLTGFWAFCTFFTYNGYWTFAGFALLVYALRLAHNWDWKAAFKGSLALAAFAVPLVFFFWAAGIFGNDLLADYIFFSNTIHQGSFDEGLTLPIQYLWDSEKLVALVWLALIGLGFSQKETCQNPSFRLGLAGLGLIYGILVLFSVGLHKFVVYGRLVRQLIPLIVLAAAHGFLPPKTQPPRTKWVPFILAGLLLIGTGINFITVFSLQFPADFAAAVQSQHPEFELKPAEMSYEAPDSVETGSFEAVYVKYIFPAPGGEIQAEGQLIAQAAHPQTYRPFLYEGFSPENRQKFIQTDITMRVYRSTPE